MEAVKGPLMSCGASPTPMLTLRIGPRVFEACFFLRRNMPGVVTPYRALRKSTLTLPNTRARTPALQLQLQVGKRAVSVCHPDLSL